MKKILSLIVIISIVLSMFGVLGLHSAAAANVDVTYAQKNTDSFINFMKKSARLTADKHHYVFHEKDYIKGDFSIFTYYYYYPATNLIRIKSIITNVDGALTENTNVIFTIPGKYTGNATIHYDFSNNRGETIQANSIISVPAFDGTNAEFTLTGGNTQKSQEQIDKKCNYWANYALIIADNAFYRRVETAFYGLGFCGMCDNHVFRSHTVPATLESNGATGRKYCHWCALIQSGGTTIARIGEVSLSKTAVYYNGKVQTPSVTVKDVNGKTLKKDTDYSLSYSKGRKEIGKYAIVVTFKGKYSGSKTLYYTINPGKPQIAKISAGKKAIALKWNKVNMVSGYLIQYSKNADFSDAKSVTARGAVTLNKTLSSLSSGTRYYVRMRSYKATTFKGSTVYIYSGWSAVKYAVAK